jgi:hypothetical protein
MFLSLALTLLLCTKCVLASKVNRFLIPSWRQSQTADAYWLSTMSSSPAADAVVALKRAQGLLSRYIARKLDRYWVVVFGRLNEVKDAFPIAYEATHGSTPEELSVKTYDPPQKDSGFFYIAANGIQLSLETSRLERRPYNTYVFPLDSGEFYVVLPAPTVADVYPLGGDTRYLLCRRLKNHRNTITSQDDFRDEAHAVIRQENNWRFSHAHTDRYARRYGCLSRLATTPPVPEFVGTRSGT